MNLESLTPLLIILLVASLAVIAVLLWRQARFQKELFEKASETARDWLQSWQETELGQLREELRKNASDWAVNQFEQWKRDTESEIRRDAVQRSQSVTLGKVTEHLIPFLPDFGHNPKDARFLGSPIDFIVFDGLCEGEVREIIFCEVKAGPSAALSPRERRVRDAVQQGRIRWHEVRWEGSVGI